jgi:hypothetical protein
MMNRREIGHEERHWIEEAQDRIKWRALTLVVLNLVILLFYYHSVRSVKTTDFTSNENKL